MSDDCWKGRGDTTRFVPGLPVEVPRFRSLRALDAAMTCCTRCPLAEGRTRVVHGVGPRRARAVFLGEAPGASEDAAGEPFVGASGRLLSSLLEKNGVDRSDVYITNVVACRPPSNRTPRAGEIAAHAPWLEQQLRLVQPEVVVTLGRIALSLFIPKARITQLTGRPQNIEWQGRPIMVLPLFHPAAVLRSPARRPALEAGIRKLGRLLARG